MTMLIFWYLLSAVILIAPFYKLLPAAGYSKYLAFGALILPAGAVILLWLLAYGDKLKGAKA